MDVRFFSSKAGPPTLKDHMRQENNAKDSHSRRLPLPPSTQPPLCPRPQAPCPPASETGRLSLCSKFSQRLPGSPASCPTQPGVRLRPALGLSHRARTCPSRVPARPFLAPHRAPGSEASSSRQAECAASSPEPRIAGTMPYKASGDGKPHQSRALGSGLEFGWGFSSLSLRLHTPGLHAPPAPHRPPQPSSVNLSKS